MSIARRTEKNPKVLMDLENLRDAFFYRHLGPSGPKTGMPLHPEPLRRTQTALILEILDILTILLQTTEKRATAKPMCVSIVLSNSRKASLLQVWKPCMSIEHAVRVSPL